MLIVLQTCTGDKCWCVEGGGAVKVTLWLTARQSETPVATDVLMFAKSFDVWAPAAVHSRMSGEIKESVMTESVDQNFNDTLTDTAQGIKKGPKNLVGTYLNI